MSLKDVAPTRARWKRPPFQPGRHFRSAERNLYCTYHVTDLARTDAGAFAIAGTSAWNSLSDPVRNPNSTEAAVRRLLNCPHNEMKLEQFQNYFGTVLKLFCFSFISLYGQLRHFCWHGTSEHSASVRSPVMRCRNRHIDIDIAIGPEEPGCRTDSGVTLSVLRTNVIRNGYKAVERSSR